MWGGWGLKPAGRETSAQRGGPRGLGDLGTAAAYLLAYGLDLRGQIVLHTPRSTSWVRSAQVGVRAEFGGGGANTIGTDGVVERLLAQELCE